MTWTPMSTVAKAALDDLMFRSGTEQDRAYFSDSIRKVLKQTDYGKGLSNDAISMLIDPILATHKALCLCAVSDPAGIVGFLIYAKGLESGAGQGQQTWSIPFLQVRKPFRNRGYAQSLLEAAGIGSGRVASPLFQRVPGPVASRWFKGLELVFRPWDFLEAVTLTRSV